MSDAIRPCALMKNKDLQADRFIAGNAFDEADGAVFTEDLTIFRENLAHSI